MSNPSISRWGINLFWYRYWFQDFSKQLLIQRDIVFETLVYYYIFFGYSYPQNFLKNPRWIKSSYFLKNEYNFFLNQYLREVELTNKYTKEKTSDFFRIKAHNLFYSRFWLMKFQNWIIINFYSFQPLKKKITFIKLPRSKSGVVTDKNLNNKFVKRLKFILFFNNYFISSSNIFLYKF